MARIGPDYEPHKRLEQRVKSYLGVRGFYVGAAPYHEVLPGEMVETLQLRDSPTGLYLRGRADRVAIHPDIPVEFEWEVKTHEDREKHDMVVEALPLAFHVMKAWYGVKCLYIYHNPFVGHEVGFWVDALPSIRIIMIPRTRWDREQQLWFRGIFGDCFPNVDIIDPPIRRRRGSSLDPFAIIDRAVVEGLSHWEDLIDGMLNGGVSL